jgi:hypothetical protein
MGSIHEIEVGELMPEFRVRSKSYVSFSTDYSVKRAVAGSVNSGSANLVSTAVCKDTNNGRKWESTSDTGGILDVTSEEFSCMPDTFRYDVGTKFTKGAFVPIRVLSEDWGTVPSQTADLALLSLGSTAVARVLPNAPQFSLSNALGELRADGLPSIVGSNLLREKTSLLKNSGDEYLNASFGWKPLVSDVRNFAFAVKHSNALLHQYRKGSDKKIRRRYFFPAEEYSGTMKTGVNGVRNLVLYPDVYAIQPPGLASRTVQHELWFSGAFRYHIPVGNSLPERMERYSSYANKLLGVDLTPSVMWELQPWSWAIDWFTDTGDVLKNISLLGKDGMVMQYGYMMSSYIDTRQYSVSDVRVGDDPRTYSASLTVKSKNLKRRKATPYGFGFNMAGLSASQDATLIALGLSKGLR